MIVDSVAKFVGQDDDDGEIDGALEAAMGQFLMLNLDDYFWPLVEHPTDLDQ